MKKVFNLLKTEKVLVLEDDNVRREWFQRKIPKNQLWLTDSVQQALAWASKIEFSALFLDHDLNKNHYMEDSIDEETGTIFAQKAAELGYTGENTIIHSWNIAGRRRMNDALPDATRALFGTFDIEME